MDKDLMVLRQRKRRYYIRGIEIRTHFGLGRTGGGGGLARDSYRQNHVVHLGLGRASWQGTQGLPPPLRRPLCPSWRAGFAPIPTKSGASRASGWICGSRERRRPRPAHRGPRRTRPPAAGTRSRPDTAEDCGRDCGAASRAGREHLQGSRPPDIHLKPDSGSFC